MKYAVNSIKILMVGALVLLTGCATVISGRFEDVHVTTYCANQRVEASCHLSNENGEWNILTPGVAKVQKGFGDLVLFCRSNYFEPLLHQTLETYLLVQGRRHWLMLMTARDLNTRRKLTLL